MIQYQFFRYVAVGLGTNLFLFVLYLVLTQKGFGHLLAMTMIYFLGVAIGFVFNRAWTFTHQGNWSPAFLRYVVAYFIGYAFNLCVLYLFVDEMGFAHEPVQGTLILVTAIFLFLLQKYWVFREYSRA